jgi:GNAT superfamily N-acetyltransferase
MFVAPSSRGEVGAAALLLEALLAHAARSGIAAIWLGTTDRFLAAHRFYEKHGFRQVDPSTLPATFPRMQVDSIFYRFDL